MTTPIFLANLPATIETPRLFLRRPTAAHVPALARLANNKKIHQFMSRMPHPYGVDDASTFVETIARSDNEHAFAICNRDDDFMGVCSLMQHNDGSEIGYWLGEPYWGESIITEAATALINAAEETGQFRFHARANTTNIASQRILEKLKFKKTKQSKGDCGQHKDISLVYYERRRDDDR